MTLSEAIELQKQRIAQTASKQDRQWLQWLLELRTLRGQAHRLETENRRLRADYETLLLQSRPQ